MFARVSTLFLFFVFALCASASVVVVPRGDCDTGTIQCCNSVQSASSSLVTTIAGLLGIGAVIGAITAQIGVNCNPLSVIGIGGNSCTSQPVCCTGNSFGNGLLVVGCSPININL